MKNSSQTITRLGLAVEVNRLTGFLTFLPVACKPATAPISKFYITQYEKKLRAKYHQDVRRMLNKPLIAPHS